MASRYGKWGKRKSQGLFLAWVTEQIYASQDGGSEGLAARVSTPWAGDFGQLIAM